MAVTSAAVKQLSDGNSQGTAMGQSTSDKIGFYTSTSAGTTTKQNVTGSLSSGAFASNLAEAIKVLGLISYTPSA